MAQTVSINFSTDDIRVVIATCRHGTVLVERSFHLSDEEFDRFLSLDSTQNYLVSVNFEEIYQDIVHIPPAETKYIDKLVRGEIRKLRPDLADYSSFYEVIGDTFHEGKSCKKVAVFSYANSDLVPVISRFSRCRKRIARLYSGSYSLSRLVLTSSAALADPVLCVGVEAGRKSVFLLADNSLCFARHIQSVATGLDPLDVQNINMTIDYCFQTLRVKPGSVIFIGGDEMVRRRGREIMVPLQGEISCAAIKADPETLREYAMPLAALLCPVNSAQGNILPEAYRDQSCAVSTFRVAACLLAVLCMFVAVGTVLKAYSLAGMQAEITRRRGALPEMKRPMDEYARVNGEFSRAATLIAAINRSAALAYQQKPFLALGCLASPGVHPTSVTLKQKEGDRLAIEVKGELKGGSYGEMQAAFERLMANIRRGGELEIVSRKLDPLARSFSFELLYKGKSHGPA